jgi:hypothetical protein
MLLAGMVGPSASQAAGLGGQKHLKGPLMPVRSQAFTVVSVPSTTPNTLIVQRSINGPEITVTISPTATLVRRFDGKSNLGELSGGDQVLITPMAPPTASSPAVTIPAGVVKDVSIQVAYTQINGRAMFVSQALNEMVVGVTANEGRLAAIPVGDRAFVDVTPTTAVSLVGKPNATIADVRPGMVLTMWGLSDNVSHVVFAPHDITQLLSSAATLSKAAPDDNTPK